MELIILYGTRKPILMLLPSILRRTCKENLSVKPSCEKLAKLPLDPGPPLIAIVSRLSSQKGVDIFAEAFDGIMWNDVQMVVLGTGEERYQDIFAALAEKYPESCRGISQIRLCVGSQDICRRRHFVVTFSIRTLWLKPALRFKIWSSACSDSYRWAHRYD